MRPLWQLRHDDDLEHGFIPRRATPSGRPSFPGRTSHAMQNRCYPQDPNSQDPDYRWPFPDPAQGIEFEQLCRESFSEGGRDVRILKGFALVEGTPGLHSLHNLADECAQLPQAMWREVIGRHAKLSGFDNLNRIANQISLGGFEQNAPNLSVRLYPESSASTTGVSECIQREDIPGLRTVLAVDVGQSIAGLHKIVARNWGKTDDELFARAFQNLSRLCQGDYFAMQAAQQRGPRLEILEGGPYAATAALRMGELPVAKGQHGNLVAMPVRDSFLSWAIDSWPSDENICGILQIVRARHAIGPYRVSNHLYWRRPDGVFEVQRCLPTSRGLRLVASVGFAQLRARLRA